MDRTLTEPATHRQGMIFLKDKIAISNNLKILHWSGDCGQTFTISISTNNKLDKIFQSQQMRYLLNQRNNLFF